MLTLAGELLRVRFGAANLLIYGLAMIVTILCLPGGLVGLARWRWRAPTPTVPAAGAPEGIANVR